MIDIDITEFLEHGADAIKDSRPTESKIMLNASKEIKRLRKQLDFQIKLADDNNNSRLRLLDVIINCQNLYEDTCKQVREATGEDYVCGMCRWDCDYCFGETGTPMNECPGFDKDDCFELDHNKYQRVVFAKESDQPESE